MDLRYINQDDPRSYDRRLFKGGKGGQKAPDATKTAAAQTQTNQDTAWYNAMLANMDQYTPYGNLTYTNNGDKANPKWTSTVQLSPEQQALYDTQTKSDNALATLGNEQIGRIRDSVSSPYSYDNAPKTFSDDDFSQAQTRAEEALYSRLNPQLSQDEEALRTRLINQGIGQGSEAYNTEMNRFNQSKNDARQQAVLGSQQYATQLLNNSLTNRNQYINEYNAQRNAPLNEYNAFTSGAQVVNPSFSSGGNSGTSPVDLAGLIQSQYNANTAASNNKSSALSSLGGAAGSYFGGPVGGFIGSGVGSLFGK